MARNTSCAHRGTPPDSESRKEGSQMRKSLLVSITTVIACLAFWNVIALEAQTAASTTPNFTGVWRLRTAPRLSGARDATVLSTDTRSVLQPWAEERCKE